MAEDGLDETEAAEADLEFPARWIHRLHLRLVSHGLDLVLDLEVWRPGDLRQVDSPASRYPCEDLHEE